MMRVAMAVGCALTVLAGTGWADEIYRWTDPAGSVHYSNTPTAGGGTHADFGGNDAPGAPGVRSGQGNGQAGGEGGDLAEAAVPEDSGFSTDASLRRNA